MKLEYVAAGNGPALVAFHGAIGNAESMEWFIRAFSPRFRVIVPSLGQRNDVDDFCRSVADVLDAEGIETATVFGISFGGLIAQSFVRRHPTRVDRLILMSCGIPNPAAAWLFHAAGVVARTLPNRAVQALTSLFLTRRLVRTSGADGSAGRALAAHRRRLESFAGRIGQDIIVARFRIAADVHRAESEICDALATWSGRILLLIANDDPLFSSKTHERIRESLPRAEVYTFAQGGHLIPLFHGDEMRRIVIGFATDETA